MKTNQALAYFFLRITMGINMLIHGFVKLGSAYLPFVEKSRNEFAATLLPDNIVMLFAYAIPWVELIIGIALIIGLYTRLSVISTQILMIVLITGQGLLMQWNVVGIQLIYTALFTWLLYKGKHNEIALDRFWKKPDY